MKKVNISIIVPTFNSADKIIPLLKSLSFSSYKDFELIINDSVVSRDNLDKLLKRYEKYFSITFLKENLSMAQARKRGAQDANGTILLHLDSDMEVTPDLLEEIVQRIRDGYDALVILEESVGNNFWARCKWLEKKCYEGIEEMESLRAISHSVYKALDGHDEKMVFSEDKDLDIRVRKAGYKVGRTHAVLIHHEGTLRLLDSMRKKGSYSQTANIFAKKHPKEFKWQINILHRYLIYVKNIKYLFTHPILYLGMFVMKTLEFGYSLYKVLRSF
jgi:arabinofuranan 3-O-arabinosyltransferase